MNQQAKCKVFNFLSYAFVAAVVLQAIFVGITFHCWSSAVALSLGLIGGFTYGKIKRNKK